MVINATVPVPKVVGGAGGTQAVDFAARTMAKTTGETPPGTPPPPGSPDGSTPPPATPPAVPPATPPVTPPAAGADLFEIDLEAAPKPGETTPPLAPVIPTELPADEKEKILAFKTMRERLESLEKQLAGQGVIKPEDHAAVVKERDDLKGVVQAANFTESEVFKQQYQAPAQAAAAAFAKTAGELGLDKASIEALVKVNQTQALLMLSKSQLGPAIQSHLGNQLATLNTLRDSARAAVAEWMQKRSDPAALAATIVEGFRKVAPTTVADLTKAGFSVFNNAQTQPQLMAEAEELAKAYGLHPSQGKLALLAVAADRYRARVAQVLPALHAQIAQLEAENKALGGSGLKLRGSPTPPPVVGSGPGGKRTLDDLTTGTMNRATTRA